MMPGESLRVAHTAGVRMTAMTVIPSITKFSNIAREIAILLCLRKLEQVQNTTLY